uniref:Uncharacterized protein n=1 Tax=Magallana gigas TaxID=29159 RepID=A0A8W8KGY5_MAGGI
MAKTRAEIEKSYRERLKAKHYEEYLKKERKKEATAELLQQNVPEVESTSGYDSLDTQTADPRSPDHSCPRLVVQMAFPNRRNGPRKRVAKALAKKSREVSTLKQEFEKLKTKHKTTQRRLLRLRRKISSSQQGPSTPRSKTEAQINSARLDEHQANKVRKHLLLSNVVMDEEWSAKEQNNPRRAKIPHNVVAGAILRKYRCANLLTIRQIGIAVPLNPETYVDDPPIDLVREGIDTNEFTFDEWKRVWKTRERQRW